MKKSDEPAVFILKRDSTCDECGRKMPRSSWLMLDKDRRGLCLSCAEMDHLLYLPSGDAALTRRARKYSPISPVVLEWIRSRKRYERQGVLVTEEALKKAEQECLADADVRARRRERAAIRRAQLDQVYVKAFAERVRALYPHCPPGREIKIAEHACLKYSGRVGRSAAAKDLAEEAIRLAVIAHIRHRETEYDSLLAEGYDRVDARLMVKQDVYRILADWEAAE